MTSPTGTAGFDCSRCTGRMEVIDSRWDDRRQTMRRRRKCLSCDHRVTTFEISEDDMTQIAQVRTALGMAEQAFRIAIGASAIPMDAGKAVG